MKSQVRAAGLTSRAQGLSSIIRERFEYLALQPARTPLARLDSLSRKVGVEVWLKADDVAPYAIAGAKARKLGVIVKKALSAGCDTLVTIGPEQSNTCRALAAACVMSGLKAHLLIASDRPNELSGNLLIASLMGAEIEFVGSMPMAALSGALDECVERLRMAGARPLRIAPGCSSPEGVIGMLLGYLEFIVQCGEVGLDPAEIRHGSATGGVWAGLAVGAALIDGVEPIATLVIDDLYESTTAGYIELANGALDLLGRRVPIEPRFDRSRLTEPYGSVSDARVDALAVFARTEGVILDPIYSGAAAHSLLEDARSGRVSGPVVLWHTGGVPSLGDRRLSAAISRHLDSGAA